MKSKANNIEMSNIDDYSSDDESYGGESLTTTFLGFVDIPITPEEQPEFEDTFIGSNPIWLHPQSYPPKDMISCDNCHESMGLLFQTYANLENSLYDRVIYVFSCPNPGCFRREGCIKAIRGVCKDPVKMKELKDEIDEIENKALEEKMKEDEKKKLDIKLTNDLFNDLKKGGSSSGTSNPFAASSNPFAAASNPFAASSSTTTATPAVKEETKSIPAKPTFAEKAATKEDKTTKAKPSAASSNDKDAPQLPTYPGFIVYMDQESLDKSKAPKLPKLPVDIRESDESSSSSGGGSGSGSQVSPEVEEMTKLLEDPTFQNFSNIVNYNPSQVLRYDINGKPLLYSITDKVSKFFTESSSSSSSSASNEGIKSVFTNGENKLPKLSTNPSPYATRRFEFQLMPKMIIDLESKFSNEDMIKKGMEWGTIIIATDNQDFVPQLDEFHCAYVQEWCGVQWEEELGK